jgi:hypothetical protein
MLARCAVYFVVNSRYMSLHIGSSNCTTLFVTENRSIELRIGARVAGIKTTKDNAQSISIQALIVHALENSSLLNSGAVQVLSHPIDCLFHSSTELGTSLPIGIFILMNNKIGCSICGHLLESPSSDPTWYLLHEREMFLLISLEQTIFLRSHTNR